MIQDSEESLQHLVLKLNEECRRICLKINIGRTEPMEITKVSELLPVNNRRIANRPMKQVSSIRYLRSLVDENCKYDADTKAKIGTAKANLGRTSGVLTNMSLKMQLGVKLKLQLYSPFQCAY